MYRVESVAERQTLADLGRSKSLGRDLALIVGFSLFVALTAQIAIPLPWTPVPITGQTLGVLLTGAILGPRRGALAILLYLVEGLAGMPVFAGMTSGMVKLLGPTGGYLMALPVAATLVGWLAQRGWDRRIPTALAMFGLGNLIIYAIGASWLNIYKDTFGQISVMWAGVYPFLLGDALKIVVAALVLPGAWALFGRNER
ncbi:biotin transporter BioY [Herpetosiphon llansteffanensis]|uniref:biotin transporter BioY n=1 Tax=Herpetosiphon llansteffanensis TaxID=2094568 RepID=UPI000D7C0AC7|nr:biotin transporter BioY [Herpetosiphon llansteffanensis]